MISKELLSEICQTNLVSLGKLEVIGSDICLYDCSMQPDIYMCWNIYELAHKCKEWALKHHYKVISKPDNVPGLWEAYVNLSLTSKHGEVADTEPEAIFKACEWILTKDSK